MLLETLFGSVFGGVLRLVPEAIKLFDRKNERAHELEMFREQAKLEAQRSAAKLDELRAGSAATLDAGALTALTEAIRGQAATTGVKWVDAASALVRPSVTYALMGLYLGAKVAVCILSADAGASTMEVVKLAYTPEDHALLSGILNFWFLDRTIRKRGLA